MVENPSGENGRSGIRLVPRIRRGRGNKAPSTVGNKLLVFPLPSQKGEKGKKEEGQESPFLRG